MTEQMRENENTSGQTEQKKPDGLANYYKRSAYGARVAFFVTLVLLIAFTVFCIGFYKDHITSDNIRYFFKYIDITSADNIPSDAEITVSEGENASYIMLYNDIAAVSDGGISLYDFAGNKLYSYKYSYSNACAVTNGKSILVYDSEGTGLSIYSTVSKIHETSFDYEVKSACMNKLGCFAVINSEKTYRSGIIVFDRDYNEIFRWMSPDKYVTSLDINANASKAAVSCVRNENGSFVTDLIVFDTSTGEKEYQKTLYDSMALKIRYAGNDSYICALTDSALIFYDNKLEELAYNSYNPSNAKFFKDYDNCFLIAESSSLAGSTMKLTAYSYDGDSMFSVISENGITDAVYDDTTLFLLTRETLEVYEYDGNAQSGGEIEKIGEKELGIQYKYVKTDSYGRYIIIGAKKAKRGLLALLLEEQLEN